ncbi:hypothetical protein EJB05_25013, partial [Eragrostis curvula]
LAMASSVSGHCFLVALFLLSVTANGEFKENFYDTSCPKLQETIKSVITSALSPDKGGEKRMGASLLRLFFHDCFVQIYIHGGSEMSNSVSRPAAFGMQGCDASVLLDETAQNSERTADPNVSLRGFNVIDTIKTKLEEICPRVVSCADILALATREAVFQLSNGITSWTLLLGRRDSTTANRSQAQTDLPRPSFDISTLIQSFKNKSFTPNELVALSGAHTIGLAPCSAAANPTVLKDRPECTTLILGSGLARLDVDTPEAFDSKYYDGLLKNKGLLNSDRELIKDPKLKKLVNDYSSNPKLFSTDFASAMEKLSKLGVLTGTNGQIRANCNKVNIN